MKILIKGGHVVDPATGLDGPADILVDEGVVKNVGKISAQDCSVVDASGKIVMPGLVDMHVHLREPGREDKETVGTGTKAAAKGGVTTVLAMPNTNPAMDEGRHVRRLAEIIQKTAHVNVLVSGCLTMGRQGRELCDFAVLKQEGAVAVSDDGSSVDDDRLMLEAFKKARAAGLLVICHCEDRQLSGKGVVNLGLISTQLGLRGIPKEAEYRRVERDIVLAAQADCPVHIAHVSCRESVDLIAGAKKKGLRVTAETAPHYLIFTEEDLRGYNTNFKMNPPLRSPEDRQALRQALKEGLIDALASDHAPHTESEKDIEFDHAEFGITGLETELAAVATELVKTGVLTWMDVARRMAYEPARILSIDKGTLKPGATADVVIVDPLKDWTVTKAGFASMSNNSPFVGRVLQTSVACVLCRGKVVFGNGACRKQA
ncbi:MAG: dihydroorotase [Candidatus Omnitrophota bacterium]